MTIKEALTYDDVLLVPQYSDIKSRSEISIAYSLTGNGPTTRLSLPLIASPMDTVSESKMGVAMWESGAFGIIHRYNSIERQCSLADEVIVGAASNVGAAIGTSGDYLDRATALYDAGVRILCVDVAHGHHVLMKETLEDLRNVFADSHPHHGGQCCHLGGLQ